MVTEELIEEMVMCSAVLSGLMLYQAVCCKAFLFQSISETPRSLPGAWVFNQPLPKCETTNQKALSFGAVDT